VAFINVVNRNDVILHTFTIVFILRLFAFYIAALRPTTTFTRTVGHVVTTYTTFTLRYAFCLHLTLTTFTRCYVPATFLGRSAVGVALTDGIPRTRLDPDLHCRLDFTDTFTVPTVTFTIVLLFTLHYGWTLLFR